MNNARTNHQPRILAALVGLDLLGAFLAFVVGHWLRISSGIIHYGSVAPLAEYLPLYYFSIPVLLILFRAAHLYETTELFAGTREYVQVVKGVTFYVLTLVVMGFVVRTPYPSRGWLLSTWLLCIVFVCLGRFLLRRVLGLLRQKGSPLERAIILGASEESKSVAEKLEQSGLVTVLGFMDDFSPQGTVVWEDREVLGPPSRYPEAALRHGANLVVIVPDAVSWEAKQDIMAVAGDRNGVEVQLAPGLSDLQLFSMRVGFKGNVPLLRFRAGYMSGFDRMLKLVTDYALGGLLLILFSPVMLIVSFMILIRRGWPVYDSFDVLGKGGEHFFTYKFRTRIEKPTLYRSFRHRVPLGSESEKMRGMERFLFRTGLDKLPQLVNVLKGEMSLVGPRTISPEAERRYGRWLKQIVSVRPGMVGNWALREAGSLEREISLTMYYIRNWNFWADLAILAETFLELIRTRFRARLKGESRRENASDRS